MKFFEDKGIKVKYLKIAYNHLFTCFRLELFQRELL